MHEPLTAYLLWPNGIIEIEFKEVVKALMRQTGLSEKEIRRDLLTLSPFTELKGVELVFYAGATVVKDETIQRLEETRELEKADYLFINPYYVRAIIRQFMRSLDL